MSMALIGTTIVVLKRNQKDGLEQGLLPDEVDRALGDAPPP
jgi:hypothetical protein